MRALTIAGNDLLQIARDRKAAFFLLVIPMVMTVFIGLMVGLAGGGEQRMPVAVVGAGSADDGKTLVRTEMERSKGFRVDEKITDREAAAEAVKKGAIAAAVVVPENYRADLLAGKTPEVTLLYHSGSSAGHAARASLQGVIARLWTSRQAAALATELVPGAPDQETLFTSALAAWSDRPFAVELEPVGPEGTAPMGHSVTAPGIMVMFSIFALMIPATMIVNERRTRVLRRLRAVGTTNADMLGGHLLAVVVLVLVQMALMVLFGDLVLGVDYLASPAALTVLLIPWAIWVGSLGLLVSTVATTESQVTSLGMGAMFLFAAFGGAMFPLEITGPTFAAIGGVTPAGFMLQGLQSVVLRAQGVEAIGVLAVMLLGYAALFFGVAVWRFRAGD